MIDLLERRSKRKSGMIRERKHRTLDPAILYFLETRPHISESSQRDGGSLS